MPAASMPALSGKRLRILPRPVTASASLKLTPDQWTRTTTSPAESSSRLHLDEAGDGTSRPPRRRGRRGSPRSPACAAAARAPRAGVTTMLRKRTLPWSPCSISGPGSPSNGLIAPPVTPSTMPWTTFVAVERHASTWRPTNVDVERLPLAGRLRGVRLRREPAVDGAAAVRVEGHLLVGVVEDLHLVPAAQVDAAVRLRLDVELDVQLHVLEGLLAARGRRCPSARRPPARRSPRPSRSSPSGRAAASRSGVLPSNSVTGSPHTGAFFEQRAGAPASPRSGATLPSG